jgi:hypothetical protein
VKAFNPYDLYSKTDEVPKVDELKVWDTSAFSIILANHVFLALLPWAHRRVLPKQGYQVVKEICYSGWIQEWRFTAFVLIAFWISKQIPPRSCISLDLSWNLLWELDTFGMHNGGILWEGILLGGISYDT